MPAKSKPEAQPEPETQPAAATIAPAGVVVTGEAPVSINWYEIAPSGQNCQVTLRSNATVEDFLNVMEMAAAAFEALGKAGFVPKAVGKGSENYQPAARPAGDLPPAIPEQPDQPAVPDYVPDQQTLAGLEGHYGPDAETINCVMVEVLPRTDGKVQINFYGNEHKQPVDQFPALKFVGTPAKAAILLGGVTPYKEAQYEKPWKAAVKWLVYWKLGRETAGGNRYKDVLGVEPGQ